MGGGALHQLYYPRGLCLNDRDGTLFIADYVNYRIVAWKQGDNTGRLVAGGNGEGNRLDQLDYPTNVLLDKENDSLIICDSDNRRVIRWSLRSGTTQGHIIIDNNDCWGLAMDKEGHLYVTYDGKHEVRRYERGDKTKNTLVAGGNGEGDRLDQLDYPRYVFVDDEGAVYVSDWNNHRVMKWVKGATEGIVVAGGRGKGRDLTQLSSPGGVFVDADGTVYVAESGNDRVTRWRKEMEKGEIIVGGNGEGKGANQFNAPTGLSFDRHGHLYVADEMNNRVQRFDRL